MSRSLLPAKSFDPPKELEKFFGDPPLIGNERLEDYLEFFSVIARAAKPADPIAWFLVRDLADIWWELRRERLIKTEIIKLKQKECTSGSLVMTRADFERAKQLAMQQADSPSQFTRKDSKPVEKKEDPMVLLAKAYLHGGGDIDFIDRRISALECRRSALLREVDRRNESMARNADRACSDFVDAEFTEAVE